MSSLNGTVGSYPRLRFTYPKYCLTPSACTSFELCQQLLCTVGKIGEVPNHEAINAAFKGYE